jgi:tetratricopeptide (TPR) repeat protein
MRRTVIALVGSGLAVLAATSLSPAQPATQPAAPGAAPTAQGTPGNQGTWELLPDGRWQQTDRPAGAAPVAPVPELDAVRGLLNQGRFSAAFERAVRWLKANPGQPAYDQGLFLSAQALFGYGDRIKSFYYCDQLLDEHPDSPLFYPALELQYRIADEFLNGYKRRFLGMPILGSDELGVEILFRIQNRAPGSVLAERAVLRTADFYFNDRQYDLATEAYGAYARKYPRSPDANRARLRQALSNYAQFRGPRFDPTAIINARTQLQQIIAELPELAESERLSGLVDAIDRDMAKKLAYTADFYRRTGQPKAASYTYSILEQQYPTSPEAELARAKLPTLPAPDVKPTTKPVR